MAMDFIISGQSTIPFSFLGLLLIIVYAIFSSSRSCRNKSMPRKPPPEAGGAWPVIGHLLLRRRAEPPHITLGKMTAIYGPIFTINPGVQPTLIVSNWEIAKECFTVNDRSFAGRPNILALEVMCYNFSLFGFSPYGDYWRRMSKITTLEVLSDHRQETFKHVRESKMKSAMKDTFYRWVELNNDDGGQNLQSVLLSWEMKKWFGDETINVVFKIFTGKTFDETKEKQTTRKALREFFTLSGSFVISDAVPYLRWMDLCGQEKAMTMKKKAKKWDQFVQVWWMKTDPTGTMVQTQSKPSLSTTTFHRQRATFHR